MSADETNPFLRRRAAKANLTASHRRAPRQEASLAKRVQGAVTPASGARDVKGDVRVRRVVRIEAKTTKNQSFSVTREMVRKIEEAAASGAEMPAIIVEFNDGFGKPVCEVAIVPTYVLDWIADTK